MNVPRSDIIAEIENRWMKVSLICDRIIIGNIVGDSPDWSIGSICARQIVYFAGIRIASVV